MSLRTVLHAAVVILASTSSLLAQGAPPSPPRTLAEQGGPVVERQRLMLHRGVMEFAFRKGYRPGREITPNLENFTALGPSPVVPLTAMSTDPMQLKRSCTSGQRASIPRCLRIDLIEFFSTIDPVSGDPILSAVPHTFIGPDQPGMYEVAAHQDVIGDAEVIVRRYSGRVVTAVFWPIPQRTPDTP